MTYRILIAALPLIFLQCKDSTEKLFTEIPSNVTGITFSNTIEVGDSISVLDSEYLYNGGGVGIGDINNDGLQDIYFSGNIVSSRLYLNKGNLKFEDITEKAGVGTTSWANLRVEKITKAYKNDSQGKNNGNSVKILKKVLSWFTFSALDP